MILTVTTDQGTYDDGAPVVIWVDWTIDQIVTTDVVTGTNQDGLPTIVTTVTTDNADTLVSVTDANGGQWVQTDATLGHATFTGAAYAGTVTVVANATNGARETTTVDLVLTPQEPPWIPRFPGDLPLGARYIGNSLGTTGGDQAAFDAKVGTKSGALRKYYDLTTADIATAVRVAAQCHDEDRLPVLSFKAPTAAGRTRDGDWLNVANGGVNDLLISLRDQLDALGKPTWVSFHHEPRNDGTQASFRAMYDRGVLPVFDAKPGNVAVLPILNGYSFLTKGEDPRGWVPDTILARKGLVGVDNYMQGWSEEKSITRNFTGGVDSYHPWVQPDKIIDIIRAINAWGCPAVLAEWGVHYRWTQPGWSGKWVADFAAALFDPALDVVAVLAFQSDANSPRGGWRFDAYTEVNPDPAKPGYPLPAVYQTNTERLDAAKPMYARTSYLSDSIASPTQHKETSA